MGGYATKEAGTTPVLFENIPAVLRQISHMTSIPIEDLHPLGSVGKSAVSNDIDLAIDSTVYDPDVVKQSMANAGPQILAYKDMSSIGIQSYAIDANSQAVQVDLMFTEKLDWVRFAYWSPDVGMSEYKGAVRTMLLMGITSMINVEGYDWFQLIELNGDDQLLIRVGRTFDLNQGIRRIYQYRPMRKDGNGYTKTLKSVTLDQLRDIFPFVHVSKEDLIIDDPEEALREMFHANIIPSDVETAEQVITLIKSTFKEHIAEQIFQQTANRARSVVGKMKLPPEITRYL